MNASTPTRDFDAVVSTSFTVDHGSVFWGTIRLSPESCEAVLDVFDREGAVRAFNELMDAHMAAGGIARVTSLRSAA